MFTTPDSSSRHHVVTMLQNPIHSRRLLLPLFEYSLSPTTPPTTAHNHPPPANPPYYSPSTTTFDPNVVMVLSVLLCALICSLGINSIIRCFFNCTSRSSFVVLSPVTATTTTTPSNSAKLANAGINKKALKTFTMLTYSPDHLKLIPGLSSECVICLSEFAFGDKVRLLPKCNHGFHVRCIDKWLISHSSCPTCRNCLIETCEKIVAAGAGSGTDQQAAPIVLLRLPLPQPQQPTQPPPSQDTVVDMVALEREGPTRYIRFT